MKQLLIFLSSCCLVLYGNTQDISVLNFKKQTNVIAPSPNASALAKYSDIPVNLHTGIPHISTPIYSWKSKKGNSMVNVSLSYHAGGNKVEDIASNCGLGWSLNAGGVITRSVRGLPDDDTHGYINTPAIKNYNTSAYSGGYYENPVITTGSTGEFLNMDTTRNNIIAYFNEYDADNSVVENYYTGFFDTEQDIFYYNVNGLSGKFVLDKAGNVNKIDENDITINVTYSGSPTRTISYFTIIADNGIKYIFDVTESSTTITPTSTASYNWINDVGFDNAATERDNIITSFYASRSIDLNSTDTIRFNYTSKDIEYFTGWNESLEYHANDDPLMLTEYGQPTKYRINTQNSSYTYNKIIVNNISSIQLPDGSTVNFYYDLKRDDLQHDSALTRIEVADYLGTKKKYRMMYSYFNSAGTVNVPATETWNTFPGIAFNGDYTPQDDHFYKRLRLDSVLQVAADNTDSILVSGFIYNDTLLPPRSSKAQDFWGYYYGPQRYAYTTLPQLAPLITDSPSGEGLQNLTYPEVLMNAFTNGVDRTPDSLYVRAGILNKITLPDGGYTQLKYETNAVKDAVYLNAYTRYFTSEKSVNISDSVEAEFTHREEEGVMLYVNFIRVFANGTPYNTPRVPDDGFHTCFSDQISTSPITLYLKSNDGTVTKSCSFNAVDSGAGFAKIYFELPLNKTYSYYYTFNEGHATCLDSAFFDIATTIKYASTHYVNYTGGLRVASVQHFDPVAADTITTVYNYNDSAGLSTGSLPYIPNFEQHVHNVGMWSNCSGIPTTPYFYGYAEYSDRTSSSTQTLGYAFGATQGYLQVTVSKVGSIGDTLGKTISSFSSPVVRNNYTVYPYQPMQVIDWGSGHLLNEAAYSSTNELQKRTDYSYTDTISNYNDTSNRSIKIACLRFDNCGGLDPVLYRRYIANTYYPYHGKSLLTTKKEIQFSGSDSLVVTTTYDYVSGTNYLKQSTAFNSSKGDTLVTQYHYPAEFSSNTPLLKLDSNYVKNTPVSQRSFIRNYGIYKEVKGEGTDYSVHGSYSWPAAFSVLSAQQPATSSYTPSIVNTYAQQSNDEVTGQITAYDSLGNIVEFKGRDGITTAVIWGYNGTLPIAKITGATYSDAVSKLTSISLYWLRAATNDSTIRAKVNEIRTGFASAKQVQVYGYTYAPLFGATSETDPNNRAAYYTYDAFGRVTVIRDQDNSIIKVFDYKYKQ